MKRIFILHSKIFFYIYCLTIMSTTGYGAKFTIPLTQNDIIGGYSGGDTLLLTFGIRNDDLLLENLHGAPGNPIVIINSGGKVQIGNSAGEAIKIYNCSYIKLSGKGYVNDTLGIKVFKSKSDATGGSPGISIKSRSHHIEIENVEITKTGFAAIMAKDGTANRNGSGSNVWVMVGLSFHNNYIHGLVHGEGFYIGHNNWTRTGSFAGNHDIDSVYVYNNTLDSIPSEGIQVGATPNGLAWVYNNIITNYGINPFDNFQNNGIQLGQGFSGHCFNNKVIKGAGNGFNVLGIGEIYVYNNIVVDAGALGIFSGQQTAEGGKHFYYLNNTFITNVLTL